MKLIHLRTFLISAINNPVKLMILGDGPLKEDLLAMIKNENIGNVTLMGYIKGEMKQSLISDSLALIISSICFETGPLTVVESLSLGVPIILNDVGSAKEYLINGYNGYLYEANNVESLKNVILKLISMEVFDYNILRTNSLAVFNKFFKEEKNFRIREKLYKLI